MQKFRKTGLVFIMIFEMIFGAGHVDARDTGLSRRAAQSPTQGLPDPTVSSGELAHKSKVKVKLYGTIDSKAIFGKKVSLESISIEKKYRKFFKINKKKGTIKAKKYVKKCKAVLKVKGKENILISITIQIQVKLPKPKIELKRGKVTSYAVGKYRRFKLVYKNIKSADRIVSYYSKKKNKGYKKGGKNQNRKKGASVSIRKGSIYYFKVVAYYGKAKSPQSIVVTLKG